MNVDLRCALLLVIAIAMLLLSPYRFVRYARIVVVFAVIAIIAGCVTDPPRQIVRTEQVEVTKYVRTPLPAPLLQANDVAAPEPHCRDENGKAVLCNGQVAADRLECRAALNACNADKAALRVLDAESNTSPTTKPDPGAGAPAPGNGRGGDH